MAKLLYDYYISKDDALYSDGTVEKDMYEKAVKGDTNWFADKRWPIVYHFSPLRENILNWYPFRKQSTILEIGAGCGALTGLLCRRAKMVTAVELTEQRAKINYERNKNYDNLEIYIGDIGRFESSKSFDYIIVNGVLEYAYYMFKTEDPYRSFLRKIASFLSPDGIILLAIENKLGLKYFAGSKEDHTGTWFSGLNGYRAGEGVKTFSRKELHDLICAAELEPIQFYYPYPDYKFPEEIFSDRTVNRRRVISTDWHMDQTWENFFDINSVRDRLMQEEIAQCFANSFLVEIRHKGSNAEGSKNIDYVKISANRNNRFCSATILDFQNEKAKKISLFPEGEEHIIKMSSWAGNTRRGFTNIPCYFDRGVYVFPYIQSESFEEKVIKYYEQSRIMEIENLMSEIANNILTDTIFKEQAEDQNFVKVFGDEVCHKQLHWGKEFNIDLNAANVFIVNNEFVSIDYEWIFDFPIPAEFVLWRMTTQLEQRLNKGFFTEFLCKYGIDQEIAEVFIKWENHFAANYVGMKSLGELTQPNYHFIDELLSGNGDIMRQNREIRDELIQVYSDKGTLALANKQMHEELLQVYSEKGMLVEQLNYSNEINEKLNDKINDFSRTILGKAYNIIYKSRRVE